MTTYHLPYQSTLFVGRVEELSEIASLLADPSCRLLTLVGSGGIGKTRLAIEAVTNVTSFTDGIYFIPLQPINAVDNIPSALATALNFQFQGKSEPIPQLLDFLLDKHLLLVLDNFEHLLDGAELVMKMLHNAPRLKILITSREVLNLREEWVRSLTGLDYPLQEQENPLDTYSAVELFVRRVRQVRGDFALATEQEAVLDICRTVEGMPLALELAAARAKSLPCAVVANEIQRSIDFLTVNLRDLPERHRSMQALFNWSWNLLTEAEQTVFMKLSVFQGGFTAEAAQAVAGASLDVLSALVEKSLISVGLSGRYQFHDLLHRFVTAKLHLVPEIDTYTHDLHCTYFTGLLAHHENGLNGPNVKHSLTDIQAEIANIRTAWMWAVDHDRIELLEQSRTPLYSFYDIMCWYREAESMFYAAAEGIRLGISDRPHTTLLGYLLMDSAEFQLLLTKLESATSLLRESLSLFQQNEDRRSIAVALRKLSIAYYFRGDFKQSYIQGQESLRLAEQLGDDRLIEESMYANTAAVDVIGKYGESRQLHEHLINLYKQRGQVAKLPTLLSGLGSIFLDIGEYAQARQILEEAFSVCDNLGDRNGVSHAFELLGQVAHAVGDFGGAQRYFEKSLNIAREIHTSRNIGWALVRGADLACTVGAYEAASKAYNEALAMATAEGEKWKQVAAFIGLGRVAYCQGYLNEAEKYLRKGYSQSSQLELQLGVVQALNGLGRVAIANASPREARQNFADALKIGLEIETPPTLLETLVGIAQLSAHEDRGGYASALCQWCLDHPALHANTRAQARKLLTELESATPPAASFFGWQSSDLTSVASKMLMQLNAERGEAPPASQDALTERELEVLRLLATRRTNREIADALYISVGTVKTHIHHICGKLHVTSRHQAAPRAVELHLI